MSSCSSPTTWGGATPGSWGRSPSFAALLAARRAGRLTATQALLFEVPRPAAELYDLDADPHQLRNLAGDPAFAEVTDRLMDALRAWQAASDDFPATARQRADVTDRLTGVRLSRETPPLRHDRP